MRLFYGLPFPHRVRRDLLLAQRPLLQNSIRGNFTSVTNFHLTLAFLGEVEEARLPLLFSILDAVKRPPFDLLFTHLDHFDGGIWYLSPAPCPPPPRRLSLAGVERRRRAITACGVIMTLATAIFLVFGLGWDNWDSAVIIYPVGGALCGVAWLLLGPKLEL